MSLQDTIIVCGNRAIAKSYAKINLSLDVLKRLDNGYHAVEMIMQTVNLFDLIILDKTSSGIFVTTNLKFLPCNEKNIAYKAAKMFFEKTGIRSGIKIMIHKNIPVAAGLAGGSGNAAAVLCAMNMLFGTCLSYDTLAEIGVSLGADVPYCINGGTQLAQGIGERLTPLSPIRPCYILLVKPPVNISTASIYEAIDNAPIMQRPDTQRLISALDKHDLFTLSENLCNVMESVTQHMHPIIRGIKEKMVTNGALGSLMSGSGPTVFGIFDDFKTVKQSADSFSRQFHEVFLTQTLS